MAGRPKTRSRREAEAAGNASNVSAAAAPSGLPPPEAHQGRSLVVAADTDDVYVRVLARRVKKTGVIMVTVARGGLVDLDFSTVLHVEEVSPLWAPQVGDVVVTKLSGRRVTIRRIVDGNYVIEYEDRSTATVPIQDIERLKI